MPVAMNSVAPPGRRRGRWGREASVSGVPKSRNTQAIQRGTEYGGMPPSIPRIKILDATGGEFLIERFKGPEIHILGNPNAHRRHELRRGHARFARRGFQGVRHGRRDGRQANKRARSFRMDRIGLSARIGLGAVGPGVQN